MPALDAFAGGVRSRRSRPLAPLAFFLTLTLVVLSSLRCGSPPCALAEDGGRLEPHLSLSDPLELAARQRHELRHDVAVSLTVTLAGAGAWLGTEFLLKDALAPDAPRWQDPLGFDASARDALRWSDTQRAARLGDALLFGGAPAAAAGLGFLAASLDGRRSDWPVDLLLVAEAAVISAGVNQAVKFAAGRARPCVHFEACLELDEDDRNLSFYSGHTSVTFTLATAGGTVASLRGYRAAPWVWAGGLALATTTGYLRIAADRHYLSDVLAGALVGSAVGIAVPRLLHPRVEPRAPAASQLAPGRSAARFHVLPLAAPSPRRATAPDLAFALTPERGGAAFHLRWRP